MNQTLLVATDGKKLREYPMSGIKRTLKEKFVEYGYSTQIIYGYIINRHSQFRPSFYGWAYERN